jgi:hypothetical protein
MFCQFGIRFGICINMGQVDIKLGKICMMFCRLCVRVGKICIMLNQIGIGLGKNLHYVVFILYWVG